MVRVLDGDLDRTRSDVLATEEPLEIRMSAGAGAGGPSQTVAVTMRTPGADFELAAGFLHTEGVIGGRTDVRRIKYCVHAAEQRYNTVTVHLAAARLPDLSNLERYGTVSSACGVCGKVSLGGVELRGVGRPPAGMPVLQRNVLFALPDTSAPPRRTSRRRAVSMPPACSTWTAPHSASGRTSAATTPWTR